MRRRLEPAANDDPVPEPEQRNDMTTGIVFVCVRAQHTKARAYFIAKAEETSCWQYMGRSSNDRRTTCCTR